MRRARQTLEFCPNEKTIFGGVGSVAVVAALVAEMAGLFHDELFHVGTRRLESAGNPNARVG